MNFTRTLKPYESEIAVMGDCVLTVTKETFNWVWCVTIDCEKKHGKADSREEAELEAKQFINSNNKEA